MKGLALVAMMVAVGACSKADTPATDTTMPAMAPAPMAMDSVAHADSMRRADSMRVADSTKAAGSKTKGKRP